MKMLTAVVRPEKLEDVVAALKDIETPGMMIDDIRGHGRQKGIELEWRAGTYRIDLLPKDRIQLVVEDDHVDLVVKTIVDSASTGEVGDGKIFVTPVEDVIRIRTGEKGKIAV